MKVNERRTVVGGLIGHCVSTPNHGERSTRMIVNGSSSLLPRAWTLVFCQFTSSPRDEASDAIVSSAGTRRSISSANKATSSAKSRSEKECGPNNKTGSGQTLPFSSPDHHISCCSLTVMTSPLTNVRWLSFFASHGYTASTSVPADAASCWLCYAQHTTAQLLAQNSIIRRNCVSQRKRFQLFLHISP